VILANRRLSGGAKLLWARLARYAGANGVCFPSCQTLGTDLGCSPRQIQRYVAELTKAGLIIAKQRGLNRSNIYWFLWHPELEEPPRKGLSSATDVSPGPSATDLSPPSATQVSSRPSATHLSGSSTTNPSHLRECKSKNQRQAERAPACETRDVIPVCPACPSPDKAEPEPLTQQEAEVMDWLLLFQEDLPIGGTIENTTVREVLKIVTQDDLPRALRLVADKLADRRRRDHHYRERIDFGLVLTILRQDFPKPEHPNMPFLKQKDISVASAAPPAISGPPIPGRAATAGTSRNGRATGNACRWPALPAAFGHHPDLACLPP